MSAQVKATDMQTFLAYRSDNEHELFVSERTDTRLERAPKPGVYSCGKRGARTYQDFVKVSAALSLRNL
jgi:hypothetical protein